MQCVTCNKAWGPTPHAHLTASDYLDTPVGPFREQPMSGEGTTTIHIDWNEEPEPVSTNGERRSTNTARDGTIAPTALYYLFEDINTAIDLLPQEPAFARSQARRLGAAVSLLRSVAEELYRMSEGN